MKRSFIPLYVTNFFGVVNDNFLKTLACFAVIEWASDPHDKPVLMGITAGMLVLPYILFSPLADRLTVLFAKRRILRLAKLAELPIVMIGIAGFMLQSPALVIVSVLLMGLQSSFYSPAKYALVRDIGGVERISTGMGGMDAITFLGVLVGTILAAVSINRVPQWIQYSGLIAFAVIGWIGSILVRADEELSREIHSINPLRFGRRAHRIARGFPGMNAVVMTLSVFWFVLAMLQMGLLVYGKEVMGLDETHTGIVLCAAAVGIVLGQLTAGFIDRRRYLLGACVLTGWIAVAILSAMYFVTMDGVTFTILLGILAFDMGLFKLPFDTEIQKVVKGAKLNTMLAYLNQVSFLFMLIASGIYSLLSWCFGPRAFLAFLGVVMLIAPLVFTFRYRQALVAVGRWAFRRRYQVTIKGRDLIEAEFRRARALLVLPNHPAMVDPMLVLAELGEFELRPLADEAFFKGGIVAPAVMRTVGAVAVPDLRRHRSAAGATVAKGLGGVVLEALNSGRNVIFYPSGHIQTEADVESIGTRQLAYNIARELPEGVAVIGLRTRGLWNSIWSRAGRTASPNFALTLLKSLALWLFAVPFMRKRQVTMQLENLTDRIREWSALNRLDFNRRLEEWYNIR